MKKNILDEILGACCSTFEVSMDDVLSRSRKTSLVYCRMAFVIIVKENLDLCNEEIGRHINRTASNIQHLYQKDEKNKYFNMVLSSIKKQINS
jgi:chromosomal replication initiation ATPase DnaA